MKQFVKNLVNILAILSVFSLFIDSPVQASGLTTPTPKTLNPDLYVTNIQILNDKGEAPNGSNFDYWSRFEIISDFAFGDDIEINEGDTMTLPLPAELQLFSNVNFSVNNRNGFAIGTATANATSRTITITFNDYFSVYKFDKWMSVNVSARIDDNVVNGKNDITLNVLGKVIPLKLNDRGVIPNDQLFDKWGNFALDDEKSIDWSLRVNHAKKLLQDVVITDQVKDGQVIDANSIKIHTTGTWTEWVKGTDYRVEDTGDTSKIRIVLLKDLDDTIIVNYKTTVPNPQPGQTYSNNATLEANGGIRETIDSSTRSQDARGSGDAHSDSLTFNKPIILVATKELTGRPLADKEFEFQLIKEDGTVVETVKNSTATKSNIVFSGLELTQPGIYKYKIKEVKDPTKTDILYDDLEIDVTVTVDADGTITELYSNDTTFNNEVKTTSAQAIIELNKALTGRALKADEFEFQLKDETGKVIQTVKNTADGKVKFAPIAYSKAGTHAYTVEEVKGKDATITYSNEKINVKVVVVENGRGQLVAAVTYPQDKTFNNAYKPTDGQVQFEVNKVLTGRQLQADEFEFQLRDASGKVIQTVRNAANGKVTFAPIKYDQSQVGTHTYTVNEKAGNNANITYSNEIVTIKVAVTEKNGKLETKVTYSDDKTFNNSYKPTRGQYRFEAKKVLKGRDLKEGEFEFELLDENGRIIQTVKNTADGRIVFAPIAATKAGEFTYTIREKIGNDHTVDYDKSEFKVTVKVTEKNGVFTGKVSYAKEAVFTNHIIPNTPPKPSEPPKSSEPKSSKVLPKTGDSSTSLTGAVLVGISLAVAGLIFIKVKKQS